MALGNIARKIFGSSNDRQLKQYTPMVAAINALEDEVKALSDEQLVARTADFRAQLANGAALDDLLAPAFATVREASMRALGMRHFDVQLIGGIVLHQGGIAEMRTGEGKTLVATLAVYLNALEGKGVHLITVNDYLASRDAEWMGKIYNFLGMSVGTIVHGKDDEERHAAYACDVTYGTNNEFGFDYLRDNMKFERAQMVQRGHGFAIVDEVDSILIDEARTPLIISGPTDDHSELYKQIDAIMPEVKDEHFEIDEKARSVSFNDEGIEHLEDVLKANGMLKGESLYDLENVALVHHLNSALRAHQLFSRDKDYIVKDDEVIIIDEFTGRMMPGRRYSEGLHQALEAKEGARIQPENQTLASITFQNYFRLYKKLAGMTGTALTEAEEFADIYKLDVISIPTNRDVTRIDDEDEVYRSVEEKYNAITDLIIECRERQQPILVGTTSIEKSEYLSDLLSKRGIKDIKVLNARFHEQEAQIIGQAGAPGAVTIATNMAGRGTDIQLGGNLDMRIETECGDLEGDAREAAIKEIEADIATKKAAAIASGGLYVVGTERHESRRIDNQLRGRSGRQGDPGRSKFFLSLQDDLMRIFATETMEKMLVKLGLEDGEAIIHPWVTKALEKSQAKVEARNFDIRKNILKFDDVMNDQRKVIFEQRLELMEDDNVADTVAGMRHEVVEDIVTEMIPEKAYAEQWDIDGLASGVVSRLNLDLPISEWGNEEGIDEVEITARIIKASDVSMDEKTARFTPDIMKQVQKSVLLQSIDNLWREHLVTLDHLSKVIGWRGMAQRDPLNEYKSEAYELFQSLLSNLREVVTTQMAQIEIQIRPPELQEPDFGAMDTTHIDGTTGENDAVPAEPLRPTQMATKGRKLAQDVDPQDPSTWGKVRRNDPCPCGTGKKFKHCHGALV